MEAVTTTEFLPGSPLKQGKVRDIYPAGEHLLIISTDRISAFDVVMGQGIPGKGMVLNQVTEYWFNRTREIIRNHMVSTEFSFLPPEVKPYRTQLDGRSMVVLKADPLPVECVVRGYLAGGGWSEYLQRGSVSGVPLPQGLIQCQKLPSPIFTPSTKAELGEHDESISIEAVEDIIGAGLASRVKDLSLELYRRGSSIAEEHGIILADTKFEFGIYRDELILIDELFTPDSSRFWPADSYRPGSDQESFDKQFLRDWLDTLDWDRKPPPPDIPPLIIEQTSRRYHRIREILLDGSD